MRKPEPVFCPKCTREMTRAVIAHGGAGEKTRHESIWLCDPAAGGCGGRKARKT